MIFPLLYVPQLLKWIVLLEQWPCRVAWLTHVVEDSLRRCAVDHALRAGGRAPFFAPPSHAGLGAGRALAAANGAHTACAVPFDARLPLLEGACVSCHIVVLCHSDGVCDVPFDARLPLLEVYRAFHARHALCDGAGVGGGGGGGGEDDDGFLLDGEVMDHHASSHSSRNNHQRMIPSEKSAKPSN